MPVSSSLLRCSGAAAAVAAAPHPSARSSIRLIRVPAAAPARAVVQSNRRKTASTSSTLATRAMPTASMTAATPAAAEQRPIPGEDLFMVRNDPNRCHLRVELFRLKRNGLERERGGGREIPTLLSATAAEAAAARLRKASFFSTPTTKKKNINSTPASSARSPPPSRSAGSASTLESTVREKMFFHFEQ